MSNYVLFDPGIAEYAVDLNSYVNEVYSSLMSLRTINQKRARFKLYINKIESYMKNNISFYWGCLLWAYYITSSNKNSPKEIKGNTFLNLSVEEKKDFDYMIQVSFLENYFESFERDTLFYAGKKRLIPEQWKKILELYKSFLEKNNGFLDTHKSSDIILPEELESYILKADIKTLIDKAIKEKNLELLLSCANFG